MSIKKLFRVDQEEAQEWLNSQAEIYVHNQNQAYRLIQLVIAAGSLLILLFSNFLPNLQGVFDQGDQNSFLGFLTADLSTAMGDLGLAVGSFLVLLGVVHVFDSIRWALKVIQSNKIEPIDAKSGEVSIDVIPTEKREFDEKSNTNNLSKWLTNNQEKLSEMNDHLEYGYRRLAYSSFYLLFGMLIFAFSYIGNLGSVFVAIISILYMSARITMSYLNGLVRSVRSGFRTPISYRSSIQKYHRRLSKEQNMHENLIIYHITLLVTVQLLSILIALGVFTQALLVLFQ